jgi:SAM-dependent methyltransferase
MMLDSSPRNLATNNPRDCWFYHSMDLPISGTQQGQWDLRGRFDEYTLGIDLRGRSVLDVGTASGFLSFEAARRGGNVVSFDADSAERLNKLHFVGANSVDLGAEEDRLARMKRGYWLARSELGASTHALYGDVYALSPEVAGRYDVVIVAQILVHLQDIVRAMTAIASCSAGRLVIAEGMFDDPRPVSLFLSRANNPDQDYAFWHHSKAVYVELLGALGFSLDDAATGKYLSAVNGETEITTLIFRRK